MSNVQLCLAHYCDHHGPTPLMVTEGLQAACSTCFEEPAKSNSPPRSNPAGNSQDAKGPRSGLLVAFDHDGRSRRSAMRSPSASSPMSSPVLETPPESPRSVHQTTGRESNFRRTYDETVTKKQGPCDNCAMTLPRRQHSPTAPSDNTPTLRTRAPAERVYGSPVRAGSPRSQCSSDTDGDRDLPRRARARTSAQPGSSRTTSCSSTSTTSDRASSHVHYIDYTSTHEPVLGHSFSLIRASCLRALSFETLPRAPATSVPLSPQSNNAPAFVTTQSAGSAATGGPIFFGDAVAGYTTAYIFRLPDVHARGHKRVYAFLAHSTHKERLAMKSYTVISNAFRDLTGWIQQLVEAEAERVADPLTTGSANGSAEVSPAPPSQSAFDSAAAIDRSASSFLSGGSGFTRRMGASGSASSLKARGLAELAGQPDIFIELHKRFVQLLFEIGVALNS
ncbi:Folliculin [Cordyceps fumosorosea ARSEF 2679]|uniref:Folliculin n=1 Tax=Cordyceps fumosorosea (strain ARSEF 2679) TaxID=1081104 RepID=A0A167MDL5_CORFA|nr:Folliculin [Cordyceps fumosorosea ARSEF 2679]OAA54237.1 Folliculin [Cordyceps fumosorosea ARSEF 2679]